jgi:hypothetical protein
MTHEQKTPASGYIRRKDWDRNDVRSGNGFGALRPE